MRCFVTCAATACLGLLAWTATVPALAQDAAAPASAPATTRQENTVHVLMQTSMGDIALQLNRDKAPITVDNFMGYVERGHYNGTIFHRVISNFMVQGGGFTPQMQEKPKGAGIKNEWNNGLNHDRGTIAMARIGHQPDSASAQFFINVSDNHFLNDVERTGADGAGYAVFGKVVQGMDVVDRIRNTRTGRHPETGMGDVPVEPVVIRTVRKMTDDEIAKIKDAGNSR